MSAQFQIEGLGIRGHEGGALSHAENAVARETRGMSQGAWRLNKEGV